MINAPVRDLLGRPVVDPYPELDFYRANPGQFWRLIKNEYRGLAMDAASFYNLLVTEVIIRDEQPYLEEVVRSPSNERDGWVLHWNEYFIPVPERPILIRLKCRDDIKYTLYFKAKALDDEPEEVRYMEYPSVSPQARSFFAYEIEDPEAKWVERIIKTNRRTELTIGQPHKQIKPYGETQALYKCVPGKTYLIQDCYWSKPIGGGHIPEILGNKQLLIMSESILKEQLEASPDGKPLGQ